MSSCSSACMWEHAERAEHGRCSHTPQLLYVPCRSHGSRADAGGGRGKRVSRDLIAARFLQIAPRVFPAADPPRCAVMLTYREE